ncbi:MAG TPA: hypothetical protein PLZ99_01195 [Parcubacteria group bacterium]|jgi:hypothetical protein|nr:hypothetical protein [Parcubacteria group bacterium]
MNEGEIFQNDVPEIEVVESGAVEVGGEDLQGQIKALETEIQTLEDRYDDSLKSRIEALKREKSKIEEIMNSKN